MPAYSKTNWVDGSVPAIDATNLNKIEQGIFDALRQDGSTTMSGQLVTTAGSAATPAIAPTGDANTGIFFPAADTIAFGEGGAEAMRITSVGSVGIGTTSPSSLLHIKSSTSADLTIFESTDDGATGAPDVALFRNSATPAVSDSVGNLIFRGNNSSLSQANYAQIIGQIQDPTATSEDGNLLFYTLTSGATTEKMRITSAGNVGIGTTSPQARLHVDVGATTGILSSYLARGYEADFRLSTFNGIGTAVNTEMASIGLSYQGNKVGMIGFLRGSAANAKAITFSTNNNDERMRIEQDGSVGIGTTSPAAKLDINGTKTAIFRNGGANFDFLGLTLMNEGSAPSTAHNAQIVFDVAGTGGQAERAKIIGGKSDSAEASGFLSFQTRNTGVLAERMRITSAGNVGIGTTSPANLLDVSASGDPIISTYRPVNVSAGIGRLRFDGNNSSSSRVNYSFVQGEIETATAGSHSGNLVFYTANAGTVGEKMRITSAGYLLIGYTSSNGAYPLQVNGQIFATSSTIATSDGRYKKDVVALDGALDIVKALNPVQFSWKDHPVHKFNTDVPTVGFIAQEVEQALADKSYLTSIIKKSECTWETETGETIEREVTRDVEKQVTREVEREITETIDGEEVTRTVTEEITETVIEQVTEIVTEPVKETHTEEFLGIAESNLIAILTKAVKELTAKVEALEAQLNK